MNTSEAEAVTIKAVPVEVVKGAPAAGDRRRRQAAGQPGPSTNGHGKTAILLDEVATAGTVDWQAVPAGAARCRACGAVYPGYRTGFWQIDAGGKIEAGRLFHWCSRGAPGIWQPAELVGNSG